MGRSIPSVTQRINSKLAQWEKYRRMLPPERQEAFSRLAAEALNSRTAIDAADEPDIGVAILLSMITCLESERNGKSQPLQRRLPCPDGDKQP